MPSLVSELIVTLIDRVSGPAKEAAQALGSIDAAVAKNVQTFRHWSPDFAEKIGKLKLSPSQIAEVKQSWDALMASTAGAKKWGDVLGPMREWEQRTLTHLQSVRTGVDLTEKSWAGLLKTAGAVIGLYGGAQIARIVGTATVTAGADTAREGARDYLAGLTAEETARIQARSMALSAQYPSIDAVTLHERIRDTAMALRSLDKAIELSETIAQGQVALQSLKGKDQALEEGRKFFKALDVLGKNIDPDEVKQFFDAYIKALGVEGADLKFGDILVASRRAKSAGAAMSNRFWTTVAPGLMQDMDAARFGTAMGSTLSQLIGGRMTKNAAGALAEAGLLGDDGKVVGGGLAVSDPDLWVAKHLIPALQKKGVDLNDAVGVASALSPMFSNQLVADIFTKLIVQREQYAAKTEQYGKAPGLEAADKLKGMDPYVAWAGLTGQIKNFLAVLAGPETQSAAAVLNALADGIGRLAHILAMGQKIPGFAQATGTAIGQPIEKGSWTDWLTRWSKPFDWLATGKNLMQGALNPPEKPKLEPLTLKDMRERIGLGAMEDAASPAAKAGATAGGAFGKGLMSEIGGKLENDVDRAIQRIIDKMYFNVSPTITPGGDAGNLRGAHGDIGFSAAP